MLYLKRSKRSACGYAFWRTHHSVSSFVILFWVWSFVLGSWDRQFQRTHRLNQTFALFSALLELSSLLGSLLLLSDGAFSGTTDLSCRRQTRFWEALFRRQVLVINQRFSLIRSKFRCKKVLNQSDLRGQVVCRNRIVWGRNREDDARRGNRVGVVGLVSAVHAVL